MKRVYSNDSDVFIDFEKRHNIIPRVCWSNEVGEMCEEI